MVPELSIRAPGRARFAKGSEKSEKSERCEKAVPPTLGRTEPQFCCAMGTQQPRAPIRSFLKSSQPDLSKNATFGEGDVIPPPFVQKTSTWIFIDETDTGAWDDFFGSDAEPL